MSKIQTSFPTQHSFSPDGNIVMIVVNDTWSANAFTIQYRGRFATIMLPPGAAGTYVWKK